MKELIQTIDQAVEAHLKAVSVARSAAEQLAQVAVHIGNALQQGGKVLVFGNGGSAADAQHLAAELVGRFKMERKGLPAIALTTDTSILTAVANDYGFEQVFARQVQALAQRGDVLIGITTSGNSANVLQAFEQGRQIGAGLVALTGASGGRLAQQQDVLMLRAPSSDTPRIQEIHGLWIHILCDLVEKHLFTK
ncbi:MAG: D-sedoheptulose 7-phosphate isomerase [Deltaproteobacteria bacterium]|nr:D-sedoheptulose 7-phosphate isomerase [Deltaproteobacteria bacterium]